MATALSALDILNLMKYEIRASKRYNRFCSLVMMGTEKGDFRSKEAIRGVARESDEFFELNGMAFVLMGETDMGGALQAVGRYKSSCAPAEDVRFAAASFPQDAASAASLFHTASERFHRALRQPEKMAVVAAENQAQGQTAN